MSMQVKRFYLDNHVNAIYMKDTYKLFYIFYYFLSCMKPRGGVTKV